MKCSGKQQPYPSEIERLEKASKEKKFNDLIKQAQENEQNIESVTHDQQKDFQQCKQLINSLENRFRKGTEDILALKEQNKDFTNIIDTFEYKTTTLEQQQLSVVSQIHDNEQKTRSLETELKKAVETNLRLNEQVNTISNKFDVVAKQVADTQQRQESLTARIHGNEQQMMTMSTNLANKLNEHEEQTMKNLTRLTAHINTVKILKWDPGK